MYCKAHFNATAWPPLSLTTPFGFPKQQKRGNSNSRNLKNRKFLTKRDCDCHCFWKEKEKTATTQKTNETKGSEYREISRRQRDVKVKYQLSPKYKECKVDLLLEPSHNHYCLEVLYTFKHHIQNSKHNTQYRFDSEIENTQALEFVLWQNSWVWYNPNHVLESNELDPIFSLESLSKSIKKYKQTKANESNVRVSEGRELKYWMKPERWCTSQACVLRFQWRCRGVVYKRQCVWVQFHTRLKQRPSTHTKIFHKVNVSGKKCVKSEMKYFGFGMINTSSELIRCKTTKHNTDRSSFKCEKHEKKWGTEK